MKIKMILSRAYRGQKGGAYVCLGGVHCFLLLLNQ